MSSICSIIAWGPGGLAIDIECNVSNGLPSIVIVGLGGKAVEESKERIRSAFAHARIPLPKKRITINLAPADIPKDATSLDLAIATSIMVMGGLVKRALNINEAMIGELGLSGDVRPVRGIIGKIIAGKKTGINAFWIPKANTEQAALIPDISIYPIENIRDVYLALNNERQILSHPSQQPVYSSTKAVADPLIRITGQMRAKRALAIAAAGGHNVFMYGPPGTGKSMLAKAFASLLPPPNQDEMLEISHLHSLANSNYEELIRERPFRSPHHSSSHISIIGGGPQARPGEVTLSHHGVLLLDEMPEFNRQTLESLRQPLEDRYITIARARHTIQYPADFILVATANPCPCGYYGSARECICSRQQLLAYHQKLSGPILDRIDLRLEVEAIDHSKLLSSPARSDSNVIQKIMTAREIQSQRFQHQGLNAALTNDQIIKHGNMHPAAKALLDKAASSLELSARGYIRTVKVARTIADLDASDTIDISHISEALQYRSLPSVR